MTDKLANWPDLVGIPYRDLGRDRSGVDCWGLVRLALAEMAGLDVPSYAGLYADAGEMAEIAELIGGARTAGAWRPIEIEAVRPLDVILFRRGRFDAHVGVVLDPGRRMMLHAAQGHGSRLEQWTSPLWASRLIGFYRHASFGDAS